MRKRTLTSELMNILRYIIALLLLFGCIISLSAAAVPNVRSVVRQDGTVVESTDYYPYGTPFTTANSVQPYKYGAKELDRMHGLDLYDSQARWYDSLTGHTSTIDPKAEKYYSLSPYLWCAGNPVIFIDPSGYIVENCKDINFNIKLKDVREYIGDMFNQLYQTIKNDEKHTFVIENYNGEGTVHGRDIVKYDNGKYYICLDLDNAIELENGEVMSVAMKVLHELGHASSISQDEDAYIQRVGINDNQYHNMEDRRNIQEIENKVANELQEPIRKDHKFKNYFPTNNVTYHKTNQPKRKQ